MYTDILNILMHANQDISGACTLWGHGENRPNIFCTKRREIFSKSHQIKPKSDCIYYAPIDLEPTRSPFGSKSIGAW